MADPADRNAPRWSVDEERRRDRLYPRALLAHGDISPATAANAPSSRESPTRGVLHHQVSRRSGSAESPCVLTLANAWGRFDFHAGRLDALDDATTPLVGVTIHHRVPRGVQRLHAVEAQPLSIVQEKVCSLLMQGFTQPEIASRPGVSRSTVIDHVRKIYDKLDVHSIDGLRSRFGETAPDTHSLGPRSRK